jgi:hypothetical protein
MLVSYVLAENTAIVMNSIDDERQRTGLEHNKDRFMYVTIRP